MPLATSLLINSSKSIQAIQIEKDYALPKAVVLGMHTKLRELQGRNFNSQRIEHTLETYAATRGWFDYICDVSCEESGKAVCLFYNWTGYVKFIIELA
ncbi:MAG: hypothetical protein LBV67_07665 [Streptococcaceae bacterium]|jgi:hypothetical protein|nr:hypothetical protein [Streptococcaceae bacterium]